MWFKAVMNPLSMLGFTLDFLVVAPGTCSVHVCVCALFGPWSRRFRGFAASCVAGSLITMSPLSLTFDFPFMDEGCKMRNMQTSQWKAAYASWDLIGNEMPPYVQHESMQIADCDSRQGMYVDGLCVNSSACNVVDGGGGGSHVSLWDTCFHNKRLRLKSRDTAALGGWKCAVSAAPRRDNCTSWRTLPLRLTSQMKWEVVGRFSSLQGSDALGPASRHKRPWRSVFLLFSLKKKKKNAFRVPFV